MRVLAAEGWISTHGPGDPFQAFRLAAVRALRAATRQANISLASDLAGGQLGIPLGGSTATRRRLVVLVRRMTPNSAPPILLTSPPRAGPCFGGFFCPANLKRTTRR